MTALSLLQLVSLGSTAFGLVMLFINLFQMSRENWLKPMQSVILGLCYAFPTAMLLYASKAAVNATLGAVFLALGGLIGIFIGVRVKLQTFNGGILGRRSRFPTFVWSLSALAAPLMALAGKPVLFALGAMGILFGLGLVIASEGILFFRLLFFKAPAPAANVYYAQGYNPLTQGSSRTRKGMGLAVAAALLVICVCAGIAAPSVFPDVLHLPISLTGSQRSGESIESEAPSTYDEVEPAQRSEAETTGQIDSPPPEPSNTETDSSTSNTEQAANEPELIEEPIPTTQTNPQNQSDSSPWVVIEGAENLAANAFWNREGITAAAGTLTISTQDSYYLFTNTDGQYLEIVNAQDFGVRTTLEVPSGGFGGISLYADLPDGEWWQGVKRLDLGVDKGKAVVAAWDGSSSDPAVWEEFPLETNAGKVVLVLRKQGNQLNLFANGKPLGQLPENGMLSADRIYFGVNVAPNTKLIIDKISVESKDGQGVVVR